MTKWADTKERAITLRDALNMSIDILTPVALARLKSDLQVVPAEECDGTTTRSSIHDGTVCFTHECVARALGELFGSHAHWVGGIIIRSDFILADMNWGKMVRAQRDTVTIHFKFEKGTK